MKTYIITGGAGFIGSHLSKRLIQNANKVYILDNLSTGFKRNIPRDAIFYKVDISNDRKLENLNFPTKVDTVFHIAAQCSGEASFEDPLRDIDVNFRATYNILQLAMKKQAKRFIYTSSMSVYGDVDDVSKTSENHPCEPISYYGCNKLASERMIDVFAKENNITATSLRLFSVYGPRQNMLNMKQGMVSIYMFYLLNNKPIHVKGTLGRFRDFIFIDDAIDVLISSEDCTKTYGEIFNVGTGVKTTVEDLLKIMLKIFHKNNFNKWVHANGSTPGDIKGFIADTTKLKLALMWKPRYYLEDGLYKMKEWACETMSRWNKKGILR